MDIRVTRIEARYTAHMNRADAAMADARILVVARQYDAAASAMGRAERELHTAVLVLGMLTNASQG